MDTLAGLPVMPVAPSGRAIDARYGNKRAEMWFLLAAWIKRGGALPQDDGLSKELTAPTYTFNASGKFMLESKDQIKDRLGFSPDIGDALAQTFAIPESPGDMDPMIAEDDEAGGKLLTEYDPFSDDRW